MEDRTTNELQQAKTKRDPQTNMALHTFIRENNEIKAYLANTFTSVPTYKTPPSIIKSKMPFNPFNRGLKERLECPTFSPTVFENVVSPTEVSHSELRWNIDDISKLHPAPIDENGQHIEMSDFNDDKEESEVQEAIDRYFSSTHMPSPWGIIPKDFSSPKNETPDSDAKFGDVPKLESASTPSALKKLIREHGTKIVTNASTQTTWSFPPTLPAHVEEYLKSLNIIKETSNTTVPMEEDESLNISTLRRKLDFSKAHSSPRRSDFNESMWCGSTDETYMSPVFKPLRCGRISPDISPILAKEMDRGFPTRLDFTQDVQVVSTFYSSKGSNLAAKDEDEDGDLAMSILAGCSPPVRQIAVEDTNDVKPLKKLWLKEGVSTFDEISSQDTGYQTCSTACLTQETTSSGDVTNSFTFSDGLDKAQKRLSKDGKLRKAAAASSTPTKTAAGSEIIL